MSLRADAFGDVAITVMDERVLFNAATVSLVTEPGTALLFALGPVGLLLLRRRGT